MPSRRPRAVGRALERRFDGEVDCYGSEARMRPKSGHWVGVLDRGRLYRRTDDGEPSWTAGTRMDITERKRAEEAVRASKALLDTTGFIANVGGWSFDVATSELVWSDQTCRIHDLPPGTGRRWRGRPAATKPTHAR